MCALAAGRGKAAGSYSGRNKLWGKKCGDNGQCPGAVCAGPKPGFTVALLFKRAARMPGHQKQIKRVVKRCWFVRVVSLSVALYLAWPLCDPESVNNAPLEFLGSPWDLGSAASV